MCWIRRGETIIYIISDQQIECSCASQNGVWVRTASSSGENLRISSASDGLAPASRGLR